MNIVCINTDNTYEHPNVMIVISVWIRDMFFIATELNPREAKYLSGVFAFLAVEIIFYLSGWLLSNRRKWD